MSRLYVNCDNVGMLRKLLERIPDDVYIRVNGKKAMFCEDAKTWTVYLDSSDEQPYKFYNF